MTRRDEIYEWVCDYASDKDGPTPTIREVSKAFGLAYTTTYDHVLRLRLEGRLDFVDGKLVVVDSEWYRPPR